MAADRRTTRRTITVLWVFNRTVMGIVRRSVIFLWRHLTPRCCSIHFICWRLTTVFQAFIPQQRTHSEIMSWQICSLLVIRSKNTYEIYTSNHLFLLFLDVYDLGDYVALRRPCDASMQSLLRLRLRLKED